MKTIEIKCVTCGKISVKSKYEIDRQKRNGREEFYCNLKCAGKNKDNVKHLKKFQDNFKNTKYIRQPDKYSNFRWYIKNVIKNSKKRNQTYDVDLEYLSDIWKKQNGICPFTKQKLELRTHSDKEKANPYSASLDRIDNTKGYIRGNIRFVSLIFNYARNTFSDDDVISFCHKVTENEFLEKSIQKI